MSTLTAPTAADPQVWIGCLACYNAGRLVGDWFPAIEADETSTRTVHATAGYTGPLVETHEELWVMDHEGFSGLLTGECSPAEATRLAEILEDVRDPAAFAAYVDHVGDLEDALETFEDAYRGTFESERAFAEELVDDLGILAGVDQEIARYFDTAAYARDLFIGDYFAENAPGLEIYVFSRHA